MFLMKVFWHWNRNDRMAKINEYNISGRRFRILVPVLAVVAVFLILFFLI